MSLDQLARAWELFEEAYNYQMEGEFDLAVEFYRRSLAAHPTAEAFTFLGWTYHFQGKLDAAIAQCKKAIQLDPDFGNPYNDIGAYLIEKGEPDAAIPWLEEATRAKRYQSYHFAHYNLGRAYLAQDLYNRARECFHRALALAPDYTLAQDALTQLKKRLM
ncbi:MAG: tetratricopeptide repeat protein [Terriglobia bacterium]